MSEVLRMKTVSSYEFGKRINEVSKEFKISNFPVLKTVDSGWVKEIV